MASLLDISLLDQFSSIFVILFVFSITYAMLTLKNLFGGNKGLNALIAATVAIMFIFSNDAITVIKNTIPWYVIMMMALMFVYLIMKGTGVKIPDSYTNNVGTWILVIAILVLVFNLSQSLGQKAGPYLGGFGQNATSNPDEVIAGQPGDVATSSFSSNFGATLFHPKVLALMLVLVIASFAVLWIGYV